jgi:hypothetical protein
VLASAVPDVERVVVVIEAIGVDCCLEI